MRTARWTLLIFATLFSFAATFAADLDPCTHHSAVPAAAGGADHGAHDHSDEEARAESRPCNCPGPCSPVSAPALPGAVTPTRAAPILACCAPPPPATGIPQPPAAFLLPWPNGLPAA